MGGPASMRLKPSTRSHFMPLPGHSSSYVIVSPGIVQEGRVGDFLVIPNEKQTSYGDRFVLDVVCSEGNGSCRLGMLFLDDHTHMPFAFSVPRSSNIWLNFVLYRANLAGTEANAVGSGATKLDDETSRLGENHESLLRVRTVPILDSMASGVMATVTFTFVIAKPFALFDLPSGRRPHGAERTAIVGCKGTSTDSLAVYFPDQAAPGQNDVGRRCLQTEGIIEVCSTPVYWPC